MSSSGVRRWRASDLCLHMKREARGLVQSVGASAASAAVCISESTIVCFSCTCVCPHERAVMDYPGPARHNTPTTIEPGAVSPGNRGRRQAVPV